LRTCIAADVIVGAGCNEPIGLDRKTLNHAVAIVGRKNLAVDENDVGGGRGLGRCHTSGAGQNRCHEEGGLKLHEQSFLLIESTT
jgi:hypothetical protein